MSNWVIIYSHRQKKPLLQENPLYVTWIMPSLIRDLKNAETSICWGINDLVAPIMSSGNTRTVKLPKGKWKDDLGKVYKGGKTYTLDVPLSRLPWFVEVK